MGGRLRRPKRGRPQSTSLLSKSAEIRDGKHGCSRWRLGARASQPSQHGVCCQLWACTSGARSKLLVGWGRRQNVPRVGFGVSERRKAGGQGQLGSKLATHCRPTNWKVLWLRAETLSEGCAPPDDTCSWSKATATC